MDDVDTIGREVRDLVGPANPVSPQTVSTAHTTPQAQQLLRDILTGARTPAPGSLRGGLTPPLQPGALTARSLTQPPGRRLVLLGAAAAGLAAIGLVAQNTLASQPAEAARPPVLPYVLTEGAPAGPELLRIAAAAAALPAEPTGRYSYLRSAGWSLNTAATGGRSTSSLDSAQSETWRAGDGSGVVLRQNGPSMVTRIGSQETYDALRSADDGQQQRSQLAAGDPLSTPLDLDSLPWEDASAFAKTVNAHPNATIPVAVDTVDAIDHLFATQVLQPADRAKVWTLLAAVPGVTYRGPLQDRLGRSGEAFTVEDDGSARGLPVQQLIIIDPATGMKLESDEVLTEDPGKLNVPIPSVLGIGLLLEARSVDQLEQRPA